MSYVLRGPFKNHVYVPERQMEKCSPLPSRHCFQTTIIVFDFFFFPLFDLIRYRIWSQQSAPFPSYQSLKSINFLHEGRWRKNLLHLWAYAISGGGWRSLCIESRLLFRLIHRLEDRAGIRRVCREEPREIGFSIGGLKGRVRGTKVVSGSMLEWNRCPRGAHVHVCSNPYLFVSMIQGFTPL